MNKLVLGVLGTAILMGAMAVSMKQWQTIETQAQSIDQQGQEIVYLNENLDLQVKENLSLEEENFLLEERSGILRDSVMKLQQMVSGLRKKYSKQEQYIALVEKKLKIVSDQYQQVKANLETMATAGVKKQKHLNDMLAKQSQLLAEMEVLKRKKRWAENGASNSSKVDVQKTMDVTPNTNQSVAFNLVGTKVDMIDLSLSKKRFSKSLKKIKKGTDWRYTIMKINMKHPRLNNLLDKNFKVKLYDQDNDVVLSYVESNPHFPNSTLDSKGIGFTFEGQSLELVYYNNDDKNGENYELRFYHIDDSGNEYLIPGATYQIVNNGKVM